VDKQNKQKMYYDLLPKIKNAAMARKESFTVPHSKMDAAVLKILCDNKIIKDVKKKTIGKRNLLEIRVAYQGGDPVITDFKLISKPSRHIYKSYADIYPVRQGKGFGVISTSRGIMSNRDARKNKVGGEYLFEVW
jgi:small subunit ribosomal protein S8